MSNTRTLNEQIEAAREKIRQDENRLKELMQKKNTQDRKERTHRLCRRGGLVEKLLPDLAKLNDEQFNIFVQKTLMSGFAEKILRGLIPSASESEADPEGGADATQSGNTTDKEPTETAAHTEPIPVKKPAGTARNVSANGNTVTTETAKAAS
jgi:hypothetical protein